MHYVRVKGILSPKNGINLYRGCTHGCIYCDSRSACYQMNHVFEDIEVKENALVLLERSLRRKRKKCMLGLGAMSDPYMPIENDLQYVRKALSLAHQYGFGFTLITKSDRVLRDLDLLKKIQERSKCVVQMTLTTADEALCKIIEPNVAITKARVAALKILHQAGIPTVVWLCPILPFINDTEANIRSIIQYCVEANVQGIICFGMGVTLREGNREYFYKQLDRHFPGMKEKYIKSFGNQYIIDSPHSAFLMKLFHQLCEANHIMHDNHEIFAYLSRYESSQMVSQMSLFDEENSENKPI